jgi:tyrosyl-tRNA synthetase
MWDYWKLLTDLSEEEIERMKEDVEKGILHPMDVKKELAMYIVERFHSKEDAIKAKEHFEKVFSKKELPDEMPEPKILISAEENKIPLYELIYKIGFAPSKSEARRLIKSGAVKIDGEKFIDFNFEVDLNKEFIIQVGKKKFARIKPENIKLQE